MVQICPSCTAAEMDLDECFPDHVVWRCPECFFRCTPAQYAEEWDTIRESSLNDRNFRRGRLIIYGLIFIAAELAILWWIQ